GRLCLQLSRMPEGRLAGLSSRSPRSPMAATNAGGAMKAALRERYGTVGSVVEVRDIEKPQPVDDQVLVRVRAASVNRGDLDGITPRPQFVRLFIGIRTPHRHRLRPDVAG